MNPTKKLIDIIKDEIREAIEHLQPLRMLVGDDRGNPPDNPEFLARIAALLHSL